MKPEYWDRAKRSLMRRDPVIGAIMRAHPNWSEVEGQRSRFRYSVTAHGALDASNAQAPRGSDRDEQRTSGAGENADDAAAGNATRSPHATHAESNVVVPA